MASFKTVPSFNHSPAIKLLWILLPALFWVGFIQIVRSQFPQIRESPLDILSQLVTVFCALMTAFSILMKLAFVRLRRQQTKDAIALNETADPLRYVGISYSFDVAVTRTDSSWDRGWLSFDAHCLCFHGYVSSFALPFDRIQRVTVMPTSGLLTLGIGRVVIDWTSPEGFEERILLEGRSGKTRDELIDNTQAICNWLNGKLSQLSVDEASNSRLDRLPLKSSLFSRKPILK